MKRLLPPALFLALAAADTEPVDRLWERVARLEREEETTTDPGRVTFALASARYRLAASGEGGPALLREAEAGFRACAGADETWRPRALLGLGNCLLLRAGGEEGTPDPLALGDALAAYDRFLGDPSAAPDLADAARQNRERARLLLAQVAPPADADPVPGDGQKPTPPRPAPPSAQVGEPGKGERPDPNAPPTPADKGGEPTPSDGVPPPGAGALPPVPDGPAGVPLSLAEAAAHLEQAAARVARERLEGGRNRGRAPADGVKNW